MKEPGEENHDLLVRSRSVLLDAIEALEEQREAIIVIGAQAVYLRTGGIDVALAEATKDSDVAIDPRSLANDPRIEGAMKDAGFLPSSNGQPGAWVGPEGIPVDLMVPEQLAGPGKRSARIPPHESRAVRRARGLEAALIDCSDMEVGALQPSDSRVLTVKVAGPAALLGAKLHKIFERIDDPRRLVDKDAHDVYRILRAVETSELVDRLIQLHGDELSRKVSDDALGYLQKIFAQGPEAPGALMAGRAEAGVGEPALVTQAVHFLALDLLEALKERGIIVGR